MYTTLTYWCFCTDKSCCHIFSSTSAVVKKMIGWFHKYVVISAILEYINKLKHPFTDRVQSRHVCWDKIYRIFVLIPAFKIRNRVWNQIMIAGIVLSYHRNVCMKLATSLLITLLCTIHKQRKQPAYTSTYWYFFSIPGVGMWSPGCAVGFPSSTPVFSKANIDDIENDLSIFQ